MSAHPFLPIVYVRGYAALQSEVNETTDDPFYGFNVGSTHVRVGANGRPEQFFFESPMVRLMSDYEYLDVFQGRSQKLPENLADRDKPADPWKTLWIYRYYDETANTFGNATTERWSIEKAAERLRDLISEIKRQTGAPRVHLVAHSMGGLICRSLLQKIYPEHGERGIDHVARFFTFATPHGGIHFRGGLGFFERIRDTAGFADSDAFGPDRMFAFLTPSARPDASAPKSFMQYHMDNYPVDNVFCAIGTNAHDYDVAAGGSRTAVGPQSDGLVQIGSAYVKGAHRAYIHRCHSGRYGIVNSEEAFQNLERFLFGDIQSVISLANVAPLPQGNVESFQLDVQVSVRSLPVYMNEQTREHFAPIVLNDTDRREVPLYPVYTQFLNSKKRPGEPARFAVKLALKRLPVKNGSVVENDDNLHGIPSWGDCLLVDVTLGTSPGLSVRWISEPGDAFRKVALVTKDDGLYAVIALPDKARAHLGPDCQLHIHSFAWS